LITERALNRATLGRQLLLQREPLGVVEAMRRVVAVQAQHSASPYLALWNRLTGFQPGDLDAAFARHEIVKTTLMRVTLHAVRAEDYRQFREAMEPTLRAARLWDSRFRVSGLSVEDAHALTPELLAFAAQPQTSAACEAWFEQRLGTAAKKGAWWGMRQYGPLWHAPAGGPWSFGPRSSFVAPGSRPVLTDEDVFAESMQTLARRYLEGFGPASAADIAQFAMVHRPRAKAALQALAGELEQVEGPNGETLFDVPGAPQPDEDTLAPPRLMAMWDSVLLAHLDRSRVMPPDYRALVTRKNGDVLPTLLVDGYVAGVWRTVERGIEATAFHPLPDEVWEGLAVEADALLTLLADRDPQVYRRYDHWWSALPSAEVRLLPAG
jgi:Winged helix DNA-binding domain